MLFRSYDQIKVTGANRTVTLTGTELVVRNGSNLAVGARYVIINNVDSTSRIVGWFDNALVEGGDVVLGGVTYSITYAGSLTAGVVGNDVVLTVKSAFDFGDAPSAAQSGFAASYPVLSADNGASHVQIGRAHV